MATVGNNALTLSDLSKRTGEDGGVDYIIEVLSQSNPILEQMLFMEGNLPTGNKTTQRTSIPTPSIRRINQGIKTTKSTTKQVEDTCCILEARSEIDIELLALQKDKEGFRRSEDSAHMEGFAQAVAKYLFYGDSSTNADEFNGLGVRYNSTTGETGSQIVTCTSGTDVNTSAWLVGWGDKTVAGIYPKNTQAGLQVRDLGESSVDDGSGGKYQALTTIFNWKVGLTVRDPKQVSAVRNINASTLKSATSAQVKAIIDKFIDAKNRTRNLNAGKFNWYVSPTVYTAIETYLCDKNNVHVTRQELMGQMPQLYLSGIPIFKVDAISETESAIS